MSENPASDKGILRKSEKRNTEILSLRAEGEAIPMLVDCFVVPPPAGFLATTSLQRTEISFLYGNV